MRAAFVTASTILFLDPGKDKRVALTPVTMGAHTHGRGPGPIEPRAASASGKPMIASRGANGAR
jgi:hypothetical protein